MSNLVVQTNVMALNSHRNLTKVGVDQARASTRLASGYRINSAADDAAGLAISEKMRSQIRGLDQASRNAQDGISLVQTAEGGMQEIDNMLQRVRELLVDVSNDSKDNPSLDRQKVQDEINQLVQGIDSMTNQVEFNKKKLIDGSLTDTTTKSDALAFVTASIAKNFGSAMLGSDASGGLAKAAGKLVAGAADGGEMGGLFSSITAITAAAITISGVAITGAVTAIATSDLSSRTALDTYLGKVDDYITGLKAAKAVGATMFDAADSIDKVLADLDNLKTGAETLFTALQVVVTEQETRAAMNGLEGGVSLWFQTGANASQGISVGIGALTSDVLGVGNGKGATKLNVLDDSGANINWQIAVLDNALSYVTAERSKLGAVQNRMEYTKNSLDISSENLANAESRIRDADMAKEMMAMTASNVLQQAGVSMLSQANQAPQSILQLLR